MFFSNKTHEEVPESRFLAPDVDRIVEEVCKYYKVTRRLSENSHICHFGEFRGNNINGLRVHISQKSYSRTAS